MPFRTITIDGKEWRVMPTGRVTQYDLDEFGLAFVHGVGSARQIRISRYSPQQTRAREQALAEMPEAKLRELFEFSQPGETSPEAGYRP
jgi:hypothetical protein